MSEDQDLIYSASNGVGHIVLNRPHRRNALTFGMYDRIKETGRAGTADDPDSLRVLIFFGGGDGPLPRAPIFRSSAPSPPPMRLITNTGSMPH